MFVVLSDTHAHEAPQLRDPVRDAVESATGLIHAGDFVREPVVDAFGDWAQEVIAVAGNVDDEAIQERLPRSRTFMIEDYRIALLHTVRGGETGLSAFGREHDADLVISGHTHKPQYRWTGTIGLLNPGSHRQPRGNRAGFAQLRLIDGRLEGEIRSPDGTLFERFELDREKY